MKFAGEVSGGNLVSTNLQENWSERLSSKFLGNVVNSIEWNKIDNYFLLFFDFFFDKYFF